VTDRIGFTRGIASPVACMGYARAGNDKDYNCTRAANAMPSQNRT